MTLLIGIDYYKMFQLIPCSIRFFLLLTKKHYFIFIHIIKGFSLIMLTHNSNFFVNIVSVNSSDNLLYVFCNKEWQVIIKDEK